MAVALRSSPTLTTVPSRISRTMSSPASSRSCQACQAERGFCQPRLTTSCPTWTSNNLADAPRPAGVHAGAVDLGDQGLCAMGKPLVSGQQVAFPFLLASLVAQTRARHRERQRAE